MTLFEWKITNLGDGQFGHIWIAKPSADATRNCIHVYVDPCNVDGDANYWFERDPHVLFNCEWEDDSEGSDGRILAYWRSIGSPVADRNSADYEAPWFPWAEAGFAPEERDECIGGSCFNDGPEIVNDSVFMARETLTRTEAANE